MQQFFFFSTKSFWTQRLMNTSFIRVLEKIGKKQKNTHVATISTNYRPCHSQLLVRMRGVLETPQAFP